MVKFENYKEINALFLIVEEIEKTIKTGAYIASLHLALTLPDMLGKLIYPESEKNKYVRWFDENVRDLHFGYLHSENPFNHDDDYPRMTGKICYALRCKLFHEGHNDIGQRNDINIQEFVLSLSDNTFLFGNYAGKEPIWDKYDFEKDYVPTNNYLYISARGLAEELLNAAKEFYKKNPNLEYRKLRITDNNNGKFPKSLIVG